MTTRKSNGVSQYVPMMLLGLGMLVPGIGGYFRLQTQNEELERRVLLLERDIVPRSEHLLRDAELNKRLDQIQENIREIKNHVEAIDERQRSQK